MIIKNRKLSTIYYSIFPASICLIVLMFVFQCGKNDFEDYVKKSKSKDQNIRIQALDKLSESSNPQARKIIINALDDKNAKVKIKAIDLVGKYNEPELIQVIGPKLEDPDKDVREKAAQILANFGSEIIPFAIELIKTGNDYSIDAAIEILCKIDNKGVADSLLKILYDNNNREIKKMIADALGQLGWQPNNKKEKLIYFIAKQDFQKCLNFDQMGIEAIINLLHDKSPSIRIKAINALRDSKNIEFSNYLLNLLKDKNNKVKNSAFKAYLDLHNNSFSSLMNLFNSKCDYAREKAIEIIGKTKNPESLDVLYKALKDRNIKVRSKALTILKKINAPNLIEYLVSSLRDWYLGREVFEVLTDMGWQANSTSDKVHVFIVSRDGKRLRQHWGIVKKILLEDIKSNEYLVIENALFAFIGIGHEEILTKLIESLEENGTKTMAEAFLNSNHKVLFNAAKDWAISKGYRMEIYSQGKSPVSWNSF